jgi:hypothetical protein
MDEGGGRADPRGYYALIGVAPDASFAEIVLAYRQQAKILHPDVAGTGDAEAFQRLSHAYQVLSDPLARERYDASGWEEYLEANRWEPAGPLDNEAAWRLAAGRAAVADLAGAGLAEAGAAPAGAAWRSAGGPLAAPPQPGLARVFAVAGLGLLGVTGLVWLVVNRPWGEAPRPAPAPVPVAAPVPAPAPPRTVTAVSVTPLAPAAPAPEPAAPACAPGAPPANGTRFSAGNPAAGDKTVLVVNSGAAAAVFSLAAGGARVAVYVAPLGYAVLEGVAAQDWQAEAATGEGWSPACFRFTAGVQAVALPEAPLRDTYWLPLAGAAALPPARP